MFFETSERPCFFKRLRYNLGNFPDQIHTMYCVHKLISACHSADFESANGLNDSKYYFADFKCQANLHKSNYAVLSNMPEWGIKYSPDYDFSEEYCLLKKLNHPQIPAVHDVGQGELFRDKKFLIKQNFIVLQHIEGYDLVDYFLEKDVEDDRTIQEAVRLFVGICDPLQYLHSQNYIHCDLKPGHLILNKKTGSVHIIDFELAIKVGKVIEGISKEYASPEQLQMLALIMKEQPGDSSPLKIHLDGRTDLYSIGLIFYQILTKRLWQKEKIPPRRINHHIPPQLETIIGKLLEENVSNRISSASELKKALGNV